MTRSTAGHKIDRHREFRPNPSSCNHGVEPGCPGKHRERYVAVSKRGAYGGSRERKFTNSTRFSATQSMIVNIEGE